MGTVTEGGNYADPEGGLFVWEHELKRPQPSPDGNDEGQPPAGSGKILSQESFLLEDDQKLKAAGAGAGPQDPSDPANDE